MSKRWSITVVFLLVAALFAVSCTQEPEVQEVTRVVTETVIEGGEEVEVTRIVTEVMTEVVTETVTEEVVVEVETEDPEAASRTGAWVDTVVVVEEPSADAAVSRLLADDIDIYAYTVSDPQVVQRISENENLVSALSYGSYNEITFNPAECADGSLNPFTVPRIREAMNMLVDREFIIAEFLGGLGVPKFAPINAASADRARFAAELKAIETEYAYNPEQAAEIIGAEMEALGATLEDEVWTYEGEPVELIALIRSEDERLQIGDYVSNQLEDIGFTVIRDYKTSAEASPIWLQGDQTTCDYNFYTGGWISTAIERDAGTNFEFFYTPAGLPFPLFQAYTPTPEFEELATRLANNDFNTLEERADLFREALPLAIEDSSRIFLYDQTSVTPWTDGIEVASDLSASVYGTSLWALTLRYEGEVGGSVQWAMPSIMTEAWNPIAGSNWVYDSSLQRATGTMAAIPDPYTGLNLPHRFDRAEVTAVEGLPVGVTLDEAYSLEFAPEISVPDDAWVDWDAENQVFISSSEKFTETQTAQMKTVVYYPDDLFESVTWHDGSSFSAADMVMYAIQLFDQAKEASPYFDEAQVPALDSFLSSFKGMRLVSTDPVVVEWYADDWSLDAEQSTGVFGARTMWPLYAQGEGAWHQLAIGLLAEEKGLSAFSADKATNLEVEHLNYISGPTIETLGEQLDEAIETNFIPYAPTLGQYLTEEEVAERYANLAEFNSRNGHYWIGTGPFFLQRAFPVEGTAVLQRYPDYPDLASRYSGFASPPIPVVELDGPGRVTQGQEAVYDVFVDFEGEPYPTEDISSAQYLVFDSSGSLVAQGEAVAESAGYFTVTLGSELTESLEAGSNTLEVVVVSNLVALPASSSLEFVTAP